MSQLLHIMTQNDHELITAMITSAAYVHVGF
jgi:hypothetical protein